MKLDAVRTHVVIPKSVVDRIDDIVGPRGRSRFLTEAAEEKLRRLRLLRLATELVGSLADVDIPGWESPDAAAEWVRASRQAGSHRQGTVVRTN